MLRRACRIILYLVFKLYQWSERSEPAAPILGVAYALGMSSAMAVLSAAILVSVFTEYDALGVLLLFKSKWHFAPYILGWIAVHYAVLRWGGVSAAALARFSGRSDARYDKLVLVGLVSNVLLLFVSSVLYFRVKGGNP